MAEMTFESFQTSDGLPNLRISRNGKTVTLHSLSPEKESERIVSRFNPGLEWVLVAGAGMGYVPEYLLRKTRFKILVYEHGPEIIAAARSSRNLVAIENNPRIFWIRGQPESIFSFLEERGIRELNFYIHRPYFQLFPEFYSPLEGLLVAYLSRKQINRSTLQRFQKVWLKNILKNSRYYAELPGIVDVEHAFDGVPAVVVGAGPSLADALPELKRLRDSVLVISTDTALSMLESYGIKPDFAVSVDPQDKNAYYLLYAPDKTVPLVIDAAASPVTFIQYKPGPVIVTDTAFPAYESLRSFWGEKGRLAAGGSVSTSAFDLARTFRCSPIVLLGQDLSFTGRQTHCAGNILEDQYYHHLDRLDTFERYNARSLVMSDRIEASGLYGRKVLTDRKFLTYRDWFQREIRATSARVINATGAGLLIDGAENLGLGEAAAKYGFENKIIDRSFRIGKPRGGSKTSDADLNKSLGAMLDRVRSLLPLAKDAEESARELKRIFIPLKPVEHYRRSLDAMNRFDRALTQSLKELGSLGRLVELTMQGSIEGILECPSDQLTPVLIDRWVNLYGEARQGIRFLERLIRKRTTVEEVPDKPQGRHPPGQRHS